MAKFFAFFMSAKVHLTMYLNNKSLFDLLFLPLGYILLILNVHIYIIHSHIYIFHKWLLCFKSVRGCEIMWNLTVHLESGSVKIEVSACQIFPSFLNVLNPRLNTMTPIIPPQNKPTVCATSLGDDISKQLHHRFRHGHGWIVQKCLF